MAKGEFDGMPERTPLGKKAVEFLRLKEEAEKVEEKTDKVKDALAVLFKEVGKKSIKVEGYEVTYAHTEKDSIKAKKEKK